MSQGSWSRGWGRRSARADATRWAETKWAVLTALAEKIAQAGRTVPALSAPESGAR